MKTFTEYLTEGSSLMKDKKAMEFVNKVVKERLDPAPRYTIKNIEKAWKRKNAVPAKTPAISAERNFTFVLGSTRYIITNIAHTIISEKNFDTIFNQKLASTPSISRA